MKRTAPPQGSGRAGDKAFRGSQNDAQDNAVASLQQVICWERHRAALVQHGHEQSNSSWLNQQHTFQDLLEAFSDNENRCAP